MVKSSPVSDIPHALLHLVVVRHLLLWGRTRQLALFCSTTSAIFFSE